MCVVEGAVENRLQWWVGWEPIGQGLDSLVSRPEVGREWGRSIRADESVHQRGSDGTPKPREKKISLFRAPPKRA